MIYDEKIKGLVEIVQPFDEEGSFIDYALRLKIDEHNSNARQDRKQFWTEMRGIFLSKGHYSRFLDLQDLEKLFAQNNYEFYELQNASTPNRRFYAWMRIIPALEDYADDMLDYYLELGKKHQTVEFERRACILDSIGFFFEAVRDGKVESEMFAYLPLMRWSLENLMIYNRFDIDIMRELLKGLYFPYVRKHIGATIALQELIEKEEKELAIERDEEDREVLKKSSVWGMESPTVEDSFQTGNWMAAKIKDLPMFYQQLWSLIEGSTKEYPNLASAEKYREKYPYLSLYRSMFTAELLDVYENCIYIVSSPMAFRIYDELSSKLKLYSQDSIMAQLLTNMDIAENALPETEYFRSKVNWESAVINTQIAIDSLSEAEILTPRSRKTIIDLVRDRDRRMHIILNT